MKCIEIQELLSAYYDNELPKEVRANVDVHVGECVECTTELARFKDLGSMVSDVEQPKTPASVWTAIEQGLEQQRIERGRSEKVALANAGNGGYPGKQFFRYTAVLAATILIGFVGWTVWKGNHQHEEMVNAMARIANEIDSDNITTLLLNKFGGSEVTLQDAITQVDFHPVASGGLPQGYTVDGVQVLDMPCCKCIQTACRRLDNSRFFIYEHGNEKPGWFVNRKTHQCVWGGKNCRVVDLDDRLAATWKKGNRYITLLGVRDEAELELLVSNFEQKL